MDCFASQPKRQTDIIKKKKVTQTTGLWLKNAACQSAKFFLSVVQLFHPLLA